MTILEPRDPFSQVVDERRRWDPEWYGWLKQLAAAVASGSAIPVFDYTTNGLVPAPGGTPGTVRFLREDATFAVPANFTRLLSGYVPAAGGSTTTRFLREDSTFNAIPTVTSAAAGLVPAFPNNTTTFFRGDGTYAAPPGGIDWINVKTEFGAVGDDATNDTTALNNAIALANSSKRPLYFPKGTYRCTTLNTLPGDVSVFGAGAFISVIKSTTTTGTFWTIASGSSGHCLIRDIGFDNVSTRTSGAMLYVPGHACRIQNISMFRHYIGIQVEGGSNTVSNSYFDNCTPHATSSGSGHIYHHTTPSSPGGANNVFHDLVMAANGTGVPNFGFRLGNGAATITSCLCVFANYGALIDPGSNHLAYAIISANYFDTCSLAAIRIAPSSTAQVVGVQIVGNELAGPGDGIQIARSGSTAVEEILIENNWIGGNDGDGVGININGGTGSVGTKIMGNTIGNSGFHFLVGVLVNGLATEFDIIGNEIATVGGGAAIFIDATAQDKYIISLNRLKTGVLNDGGTGVNKIVINNLGY